MADTDVNASSLVENITENGDGPVNGTKIPASPEGMAIAYTSLLVMAVLPIFFGAFRSVHHHKEQKANANKPGAEKPETMTNKDAAMFPVIASCALFGLYCFFRIFSKEYINILLTSYFFFLGVFALAHLISPVVVKLIPDGLFTNIKYQLLFLEESTPPKPESTAPAESAAPAASNAPTAPTASATAPAAETPGQQDKKREDKGTFMAEVFNYEFDRKELIALLACFVVGVWYLYKKHWVANNLFGIAFAVNGVELLQLNSVSTGCILLGGLFIYDIFWVFGTDVMVTVAKSFEAPIKLVFPQDLLEQGLGAKNFAMLGLGDIVIPGIFIALLLRYDVSHNTAGGRRVYFWASFVAYIAGLVSTIVVMHVYKHAQPALLYLVPACLGVPLALALARGELKQLLAYEDHSEAEAAETPEEKKDK